MAHDFKKDLGTDEIEILDTYEEAQDLAVQLVDDLGTMAAYTVVTMALSKMSPELKASGKLEYIHSQVPDLITATAKIRVLLTKVEQLIAE